MSYEAREQPVQFSHSKPAFYLIRGGIVLKKLSLFIFFISSNTWSMEHERKTTLTTRLKQGQGITLPYKIIDKIITTYIHAHSKTPRQFVECLQDLITNWRLATKSFDLSKERIIVQIKETKKIKGLKFIEQAFFKAIFLDYLNITSWLYDSLKSDTNNSMAYILQPLTLSKFNIKSLHKSSDKLIGFVYYRLGKIESLDIEELKALICALLFILQYTDFDQNDLKREVINYSILALQNIAYANGLDTAKKNLSKSFALIKFLAKICALDYLSLDDIEQLWAPFFEKYRTDFLENNRSSQYSENKHSWIASCLEADQSIKNLLQAKYEQFKSIRDARSNALTPETHTEENNYLDTATEKISGKKEPNELNTCELF